MGDDFPHIETDARTVNGWIAILSAVTLLVFGAFFLGAGLPQPHYGPLAGAFLLIGLGLLCIRGAFTLQPNEAAVMIFFGSYAGTARHAGFHWANPLCLRQRLSLRAQNLTTPILKVNDGRGNPIEIGAVVVWRVHDTARALFEVEDYADYVKLQCESSLREVAARHAYESVDETLVGARVRTLRGDADRISEMLRVGIQARVRMAGIAIDEARIAHIAYAPEIAQAMLRRQQAEAVLAARRKLVEGAVGMVESALIDINEKSLASFTPAQRVALVTNLMTVLVGEGVPHPVVPLETGARG
jgi:regulator of protease activity HflC (stomatin/prohibitin superfamily)